MTNEQLVLRIQAGEDVAENMSQLYEQNRGFMLILARQFSKRCEIDDLMQEGYFGLLDAVNRWDQGAETVFMTYAADWIRNRMRRYVFNCCGDCRLSEHRQIRALKYLRIIADYERDKGRRPRDAELIRITGWKPAALDSIRMDAAQIRAARLDKPAREGGATIGELIPGKGAEISEALDREQHRQLAHDLWAAVDELRPKEAAELRKRYQEELSFKEIGATMGMTAAQASSLERRSLEKLRRSPRARRLLDYLSDSGVYSRGIRPGDSTARTAIQNIEHEQGLLAGFALQEWNGYNAGL